MTVPTFHEFEQRAAKARDHEGSIVGYYFDADSWRELRARLTAIEALLEPACENPDCTCADGAMIAQGDIRAALEGGAE